MGETRHPPGRLLDDDDRRVQSGPHLPSGVGVPRRAREKVERLCQRPGVAGRARREREGRADRRHLLELHPATHVVLERTVARPSFWAGYRPTEKSSQGQGALRAKLSMLAVSTLHERARTARTIQINKQAPMNPQIR